MACGLGLIIVCRRKSILRTELLFFHLRAVLLKSEHEILMVEFRERPPVMTG